MRKLLIMLFVSAFCAAAHGTITRVATASGMGQGIIDQVICSGTSVSFTLPHATGTGHLIVFALGIAWGNSASISSVSLTSNTLNAASSFAMNGNDGSTWLANAGYYRISSVSGATAFTVTVSTCTGFFEAFLAYGEYSTDKSFTFDTSNSTGSTLQTCSTTNCVGPALTLTGTNDVIFQLGTPFNKFTAVSSPYTGYFDADGEAGADNINTNSGAAVTWTNNTSGGTYSASAMAFYDTAAAAAICSPSLSTLGVSSCG